MYPKIKRVISNMYMLQWIHEKKYLIRLLPDNIFDFASLVFITGTWPSFYFSGADINCHDVC